MTDSAKRQAVREWYGHALGDVAMARSLLGPGMPARGAAFHAQQAAEKAIKAALIAEEVAVPHTHDLDTIRNRLPVGWRVKRTHPDLAALSDYAVETRYPDNVVPVTKLQASNAIRQAVSVVTVIAGDLERRGIAVADAKPG